MRRQQRIAQRFRRVLPHQIMHTLDIAHRLGHLGAAEIEHAVVQPPACERCAAVRALALRHFVFVMRELQVNAAGMDVDGGPQMRRRHRRAFDMPTRAATAPRRVPAGQIVAGGFPQHEITGVAFVGSHVDASAGQHVVGIAARELAVASETTHCKQHVMFGGVGVAIGNQAFDHRNDLADMPCGFRLDIGGKFAAHAQRGHVVTIGRTVFVGDRADWRAQCFCRRVDLVVHVGDVAGIAQATEAPPQQRRQHAKHHRSACIADMHVVVNSGAADVHRGAVGNQRDEKFGAAAQGVVKKEAHGSMRVGCAIVTVPWANAAVPLRQRRFIRLP